MKTTANIALSPPPKASSVKVDMNGLLMRRVLPVASTLGLWALIIEGVRLVSAAF